MEIIDFGLFIALVEFINLSVPWRFIFVGPHVGETQCACIAVVKVCARFSTLIGTRHKAPVRC
ncbi:hypothetical protein SDC9_161632 [bioreactor metagenome]|uniref:Uncharacterized protein n=1 Tax=bioreactor metagenome TaxID=1076179 RepID=A0A645FKW7_9ZZZZ